METVSTEEIQLDSNAEYVKDGKVYVEHSDCKEQLCVHQTPITKDGGSIVCLPNRVVIRVENREIDAVS